VKGTLNPAGNLHEPTPRLSIIIATWQAASTLKRCLDSILEQEFEDWELLIADGNSSDGTVELIRKYEPRIAWWQSKEDGGVYDAWNQALLQARGEYVCFLGADDAWLDSSSLSRLFEATGDRDYDLITSRGLFVDSSNDKSFPFGSAWNYRRIGRRTVVCHPGLLHRRSLFLTYGLFDTHYRIAGDLDFLLRLPKDLKTLHVDANSVIVEAAGISRRNVLERLREQREVLMRCERYGPIRAYLVWIDKLIRLPFARLLNISH
jgi:glycosyltransferase involved in cell wall biosynthesis